MATSARLPPEERFLLACARATREPAAQQELAALEAEGIDWERLRASAVRHGMLVILAKWLADHLPDGMPPAMANDLRRLYLHSTAASLRKLAEAERAVRHLRDGDIASVPFKGPLLSLMAYGDAGLRVSTDLDLLLAREDVERAMDLLAGLGYQTAQAADRSQWAAILRYQNEWPLVRSAPPAQLDLHWAVAPRQIACGLDVRQILARSPRVEVAGYMLPSLDTADLILMLCIHGAKHDWDALELICSLAGVVGGAAEVDWTTILGTASASGCRRRCLLGGLLAAELLRAPIPGWFLDIARADRGAADLATLTMESLSARQSRTTTLARHMKWQGASLDGYGAKTRYFLLRTFEPSPEDWGAIRLPPDLYFLHYPMRPPRLIVKHAARIARR